MKIFISYRRGDSTPMAGRIHDRLTSQFGEDSVFMDIDSIPIGIDFRHFIDDQLEECDMMLAIIGNNWVGADHSGRRRIDDPADFVRIEIQAALSKNIPIVPLLVANVPVPNQDELPDEVKPLSYRNGVTVDPGIDFHHHMDRVTEGLTALFQEKPQSPTATSALDSKRNTRPQKCAEDEGSGLPTPNAERDRLNRIAEKVNSGDLLGAIPELEEYLADNPRDDLAWTILGHACRDADRLDESLRAFESALSVNPRQLMATHGLGVLHRKRKDYDAAMDAYEKTVQIDPNYADAFSSMSIIALKRNEDEKALEYAQKGYELDKANPVIAANLAVAYHYKGDRKNRDKFTKIAKQLGYKDLDSLQKIYSGNLTLRE